MMKKASLLASLFFGSIAAQAQPSDSSSSSSVDILGPGEVAIVNGQRIPESLYRLYTIAAFQANPDTLPPEAREEIINQLVAAVLLAQEAERSGLHRERRIAAELELNRLQLLSSFMSDRYVDENPPTEAEIRLAYQEALPLLDRTEYKVRHILVETEREAERIIDDLDDGDDFAELAEEHSTDASAASGGDLGWISVDSAEEPFAAAVAATAPGTHTREPIQTDFGWHVIRVDESRQSSPPPLSAIQDELISAINAQRVAAFVASLRQDSDVVIVE